MDVDTNQSNEIFLDALPYIDAGYNQEKKSFAERLINLELNAMPDKNYLASRFAPTELNFSSELIQTEWERVCQQKEDYSTDVIKHDRYTMKAPEGPDTDVMTIHNWYYSLMLTCFTF
eukprot:TRINITY_DN3513_c0_g1_i1.p1 TRINITY_DN3513_c0_g1~~TRINITY_DN3513_c0_g1_i1.p1  ORF type:complete len:118 (-),score=11.36 TRINITY_DN3513_c0_g1_i1:429-782(-)